MYKFIVIKVDGITIIVNKMNKKPSKLRGHIEEVNSIYCKDVQCKENL